MFKRLIAIISLVLLPTLAHAQFSGGVGAENGTTGSGTVTSVSGALGITISSPTTTPAVSLPTGTAAQLLIMNAGATAYVANSLSGDCTITAAGVITCTKEFNLSAGNALYGVSTVFASGQQIAASTATVACHFTNLTSINTFHGATCTTAPTFNVFDGASTTGTAKIASASLQGTRGTVTSQTQTLVIGAGDVFGIYVSTQGGTCVNDQYTVTAEIACP